MVKSDDRSENISLSSTPMLKTPPLNQVKLPLNNLNDDRIIDNNADLLVNDEDEKDNNNNNNNNDTQTSNNDKLQTQILSPPSETPTSIPNKKLKSRLLAKIRKTPLFEYHHNEAKALFLQSPSSPSLKAVNGVNDTKSGTTSNFIISKLDCSTLKVEMLVGKVDVNINKNNNRKSNSDNSASNISESEVETSTSRPTVFFPSTAVNKIFHTAATKTKVVPITDQSTNSDGEKGSSTRNTIDPSSSLAMLSTKHRSIISSIKSPVVIKGQSKSIIHTGINTLGDELMFFNSVVDDDGGLVLRVKYNNLLLRESGNMSTGGRKIRLPFPTKIHTDDPDCIIVRSYIQSSNKNEVFSVVQRYVKVVVSEKEHRIVYWTLFEDELPSTNEDNNNNEFFTTNKIKRLVNSYSERGNIVLLLQPHRQTSMQITVEIVHPKKLFNSIKLNKRLINAINITNVANEVFDRSDAVDDAVRNNFVDFVLPKAKGLTVKEKKDIAEVKNFLKIDNGDNTTTGTHKWKRIPGTLQDTVSKFQSNTSTQKGGMVVKGVVQVDTTPEIILSYIMNFMTNDRLT